MSAIARTGAMLLNGQNAPVVQIGRSLPHLARRYDRTPPEASPKFLCLSDGDDETPRVLLTGGLLVRIQPEDQSPVVKFHDFR
jgi:hypothetical protein